VRRAVVVIVVCSLAFALPKSADATGVKSLTIPCPTPASITKPGTYLLRTATHTCAASTQISIVRSNVTIDLGGRVLDGDGPNCSAGITVNPGLHNVVIRNGTIEHCIEGVYDASSATIEHLVLMENGGGVYSIASPRVIGNTVTRCTAAGTPVGITTAGGRIIGNKVIRCGNAIVATGKATISGNTVAAGVDGISTGDGSTVDHNFIADGDGAGVSGTATGASMVVRHNTIVGMGQNGIDLRTGNAVEKNVVKANAGNGIYLTDHNTVSSNRAFGNGEDGIFADGTGDVIDGNTTNGNDYGIGADDGNTIANNVMNGNLIDGLSSINNEVIKKNDAEGNGTYGLSASSVAAGNGTNRTRNNGTAGCSPTALCVGGPKLPGTEFTIACPAGKSITQPGTYLLTTAENCSFTSFAIQVTASHVTVNLQGRAISTICQDGIVVEPGLTDVTIANGVLIGSGSNSCQHAVESGAAHSVVTGLAIRDVTSGIELMATSNVISGNLIEFGAFDGIVSHGKNDIAKNTVIGMHPGIHGQAGDVIDRNTVVDGDNDISVGDGATVIHNRVFSNDDTVSAILAATSDTVTGNLIVGTDANGIRGTNSNTIANNTVIGVLANGIDVLDSNTIRGNRTLGNLQDGIYAAGAKTVVEANVSDGNLYGVGASDTNVIVDNVMDGNEDDGLSSNQVKVVGNHADGNVQDGILADTTATGHGNHARFNGATQCDPARLCA